MSRRPGMVFALLAAAAVAAPVTACTTPAAQPTQPATSTGTTSPDGITVTKAPDVFDLQGHAATPPSVAVQSISSWQPRLQVVWPRVAGAQALNIALASAADTIASDFRADAAPGDTAPPSLTTTWTTVTNADGVVGIRLATQEFSGASTGTWSTTSYGSTDGREAWTGAQLVADTARGRLVDLAARAAQAAGLRDADSSDADEADVLRDVSFDTRGNLSLLVAKSGLASADAGPVKVVVPAAVATPLLSVQGRRTQQAARSTTPSSAPTAPASPAPTALADTTDCTRVPCVALTFDDGPGPLTSGILDTLVSHDARASFFVLGRNASVMPDVVARAARLGMAVGDHSWTHRDLSRLPASAVLTEITTTAGQIRRATGAAPFAVRPPYGAFTPATPHAGLPFVLWDVDTEDWKNRDAGVTTQRALAGAHAGAIVLMHDIHPSTAKALPGIIEGLQSRGYHLVTVPTLLRSLDPAGSYYRGPSMAR